MSTKPGATTHPSASMTRSAPVSGMRPTATMTPSCTAMSAVYAGSPLPSTTVPARTSRSISDIGRALLVAVLDVVDARRVRADDLAPAFGRQRVDMFHELVDHARVLRIRMREV